MLEPDFDAEKLRPAEYICEPDPRNAFTAWHKPETGEVYPVRASDLHDAVSAFSLNTSVPADVAQHFETAKNVYLYSWFIYRFQPVAELQSLVSLEFALRLRLAHEISSGKIKHKMLWGLLKYSIENGLIKKEGFARWVKVNDPEWDLLASLEKALPQIRNDHAHGSYTLTPTALGILELVYEMINQLFPAASPISS
jgi:hypothetical protein